MCEERIRVLEEFYPDGRVRRSYPDLGFSEELMSEFNRMVYVGELMLVVDHYDLAPWWKRPFLWVLDRIGGI